MVVILVATVISFMAIFIFSMFCVVRKCRQNRRYPDSQPLKKRVVVMRSNILYADSYKDQNSQVGNTGYLRLFQILTLLCGAKIMEVLLFHILDIFCRVPQLL